MTEDNEYIDILADLRTENEAINKGKTISASQFDADKYGQAITQEEKRGTPAPVAYDLLDQYTQEDSDNEYMAIVGKNKVLSDFHANDNNFAPVARDDAHSLDVATKTYMRDPSWMEATFGSAVAGGTGLISGFGAAYIGASDVLNTLKDKADQIHPLLGSALLGQSAAGSLIASKGSAVGGDTKKYFDELTEYFAPKFEGDFTENPSFKRGVSAVTQAAPSLVASVLASLVVTPAGGAAFLSAAEAGPMYIDAREAGKDVGESAGYAAAAGLITFFLEKYGLEGVLKEGKTLVRKALTGMFKEGGTEGLQQVAQNAIAMIGYDDSVKLLDGVVESIIGGAGSGGIVSSATHVVEKNIKARNAEANRAYTEHLINPELPGKTGQRAKSLYQSVIQKAADRDGGLSKVFIPAESMVEYVDSLDKEDRDALFESSPSLKSQYAEAVAIGADLVFPAGEFAANIAPLHGSALAQDIRLGAGEMTLREAEQWREQNPEIVAELQKQAEEMKAAVEANQTVYEELVAKTKEELIATGRYTTQRSETQAELFASGIVAMAQRSGIDPNVLAEMYPVTTEFQQTEGGVGAEGLAQSATHDLLKPQSASLMVGNESLFSDDGDVKAYESDYKTNTSRSFRYVKYDGNGDAIGVIQIHTKGKRSKKAVISNVYVRPDKRRQGIAASLLKRARKDFDVKHSDDLTNDGAAFAAADGVNYQTIDRDKRLAVLSAMDKIRADVLKGTANEQTEIKLATIEGESGSDLSADVIRDEDPGISAARELFASPGFGNEALTLGDTADQLMAAVASGEVTKPDAISVFAKHLKALTKSDPQSLQAILDIAQELRGMGHEIDQQIGLTMSAQLLEALALEFRNVSGPVLFQSAFHGSPHTFDKFRMSAIGTGEGAQAYGYGLYFAGAKEVAEYYRETLSRGAATGSGPGVSYTYKIGDYVIPVAQSFEADIAYTMQKYNIDPKTKDGEDWLNSEINARNMTSARDISKKAVLALYNKGGIEQPKSFGRLYAVELAPADDEYLLWDKPLSEQSDKVLRFAEDVRSLIVDTDPEILADYLERFNADFEELTGEEFYRLTKRAGVDDVIPYLKEEETRSLRDDERASMFLHSLGIRGIKYLDGSSRGRGDGNYNYVIFNEDDVAITAMFQRNVQLPQDVRGGIFGLDAEGNVVRISDPSSVQTRIALTENANLTTFLHETGHFYLQMLRDLAMMEGAADNLVNDWNTIKGWLGVGDDNLITTAQHEKFADGFLTYLEEGKAPSKELESAFGKFRAWLTLLYKSFEKVELSDDVRRVFDRMVATDEEIARAERQAGTDQVFKSAEDAGMTQAEWADYLERVESAREDARAKATAEVLRELKREQTSVWKDAKRRLTEAVTGEVEARKDVIARSILRAGIYPGGDAVPAELNIHLRKEDLTEAQQQKMKGMWRKEGGVDIDTAAQLLGYASGPSLLSALESLPPKAELIKSEVDRRLKAEFGDMMEDGQLKEIAEEAIQGERRGDLLMYELRMLSRRAGKKLTPESAIKDFAVRQIAEKREIDIDPQLYRRAMEKASREAIELAGKGDAEGAFAAKQRQILNHHLYKQATEAKQFAVKVSDHMNDLGKAPAQKRLAAAGGEFLEQINALRDRFGFAKITNKAFERKKSLEAWINDLEAKGEDVAIEQWIIDGALRPTYREMTIQQLRDVYDVVRHMEHLARLKNQLLTKREAIDLEDAAAESATSAYNSLGRKRKQPIDKNMQSRWQKMSAYARKKDASMMKIEQLIEWLDDGDVDGPWSRNLWDAFVEAQNDENDMTEKHLKGIAEAFTNLGSKPGLDKEFKIDFLGQSVTKRYIITVALNLGNASNKFKLLEGRGWTEQNLNDFLKHMTKEDWDTVQAIWDQIGTMWPDIVALEKKVRGVPPKGIDPTPISTPFGVYKGGYFPVVYDMEESNAGRKQANDADRSLIEGYVTRATTPKGHIEGRIAEFSAPIKLGDLGIIPAHMSAVIHDLTHRVAVRNANKFLSHHLVEQAVKDTLGNEYLEAMRLWVQGIANDRVLRARDGLGTWSGVISKLRTNTTMVAMGYKFTTKFAQLAGYLNSLDVVPAGALSKEMASFMYSPLETTKYVQEKSGEMRHRIEQRDRDVKFTLRKMKGKKGYLYKVQEHAFTGIGYFDLAVSVPTWIAAYRVALAEGRSEEVAIKAGDRAVRLSQGAGGMKDLAAVMRGNNDLMDIATMFYSYFSALYARMRNMGHLRRMSKDSYMRTVYRAFFLFIAPAVVGELLASRGPDDDEEPVDWALRTIILYPFSTIPILRDIMNNVIPRATGGKSFGYKFSPVASAFQKISDAMVADYQYITGEEDLDVALRKTFEASGYLFGLPTGQASITGAYIYDLMAGNEDPEELSEFLHNLAFRRED